MTKPYEELEFTDNFMFVKVMSAYPDLCRELLELILQKKIRALQVTDYEKTVLPSYQSHGIRMDVYAEDEENTVYDIEMQAQPEADLPLRSRYYHSVMDMEQLAKGCDYSSLKKSYVIFLCKNVLHAGLCRPKYTFCNRAEEDPGIVLEDNAWTILINAQYKGTDIPSELKDFLTFIRIGKAEKQGSLADRLGRIVKEAVDHGRWSADYMRWEDEMRHREYVWKKEHRHEIDEAREEALEEGRKEAMEQAQLEIEQVRKESSQETEALKKQLEAYQRIYGALDIDPDKQDPGP